MRSLVKYLLVWLCGIRWCDIFCNCKSRLGVLFQLDKLWFLLIKVFLSYLLKWLINMCDFPAIDGLVWLFLLMIWLLFLMVFLFISMDKLAY